MPCTPFSYNGISGIVCTRGRRVKRCACGSEGTLLCDWKMGPKKTCDKPICAAHGLKVAEDKHLCPAHQKSYAQWKAQRPKAEA